MERLSSVYSARPLTTVLGCLLVYTIAVVFYRLTLHPLARYPGPLLGRLTSWSIVFQAGSGDRHLKARKEHETYGPIVRIGPNAVSINTIHGLQAVYGSRTANVQKSSWYRTVGAAAGGFSTHSEVDRQRHSFRRRVLEHAFTERALLSAEKFVHDNVEIWLKFLGEGRAEPNGWSPARNMSDWCTYLKYDIMGDLTFGKRFDCISDEEHRYVPGVMMDTTKVIHVAGYLPFNFLVRSLMGSSVMNRLAGEMSPTQKYFRYANSQMERRIAAERDAKTDEQTRKDFSHYLINAKDAQTGRGLSTEELHAESSLLISAGSDTAAVTLSATLFYLLHYPDVLKKLTAQIRSEFSSVDQINGRTTNGLVYLRACIDEALRLSPPVPAHLPREVLKGGITVEGHYFPPGTIVGTSAYAIHHNPEYYPEPFKYQPDRWIVDENAGGIRSANAVATARAAFCAFSLGRRGCVGKNIAYRELEIALGKLLYTYDIRLPETKKASQPSGGGAPDHKNPERRRNEEYQLDEHFISIRHGPTVQFRAVEPASDRGVKS